MGNSGRTGGDPGTADETRSWLRKSAEDLRAAEILLAAEPPAAAPAAFHCQQAVEKAMKALLCWHDVPFRKTHSLVELGEACAEVEPSLAALLRGSAPLTAYATRFRYPGEPREVSPHDARAAVDIARDIYEAILTRTGISG